VKEILYSKEPAPNCWLLLSWMILLWQGGGIAIVSPQQATLHQSFAWHCSRKCDANTTTTSGIGLSAQKELSTYGRNWCF
jgi:hypothetical protein